MNATTASPHTISEGERYFNTVFLTLALLLAIIGNAIALHAFFVSPQLKKITYYFIASLCFSDLMVAIIIIPIWVVDTQLGWKLNGPGKSFHAFLDIFCSTWSIMSLAMISIERYICIKYALRYYAIMTRRRGLLMILFILIYSLVAAIINHASLSYFEKKPYFIILQWVIFFMSYAFPVLIKLFTYTKIYIEAKRQSKLIKEQYSMISKTRSIDELESIDSDNLHFNNKEKRPSSGSRASWGVLSTAGLKFLKKKKQTCDTSIAQDNSSDEADFEDFCSIKKLIKKRIQSREQYDVNQNGIHENRLDSSISDSSSISGLSSFNKANSNSLREKNMLSIPEEMLDTISLPDSLKDSNEQTFKTQIYCEVGSRDRTISCPEYAKMMKKSRLSLETSENLSYHSKKNTFFNKIRYSMRWSPASTPIMQRVNTHTTKSKRDKKLKQFKREMRATKVIGLIMGTFLFCWTPFMIIIIFSTIPNPKFNISYLVFAKDLHYLNSTINPILYVVLNRVYRSAVFKIFERMKQKLFCLSKTI